MPKFVYYILIASGFVVLFEILANSFYEEIGYVEEKSKRATEKDFSSEVSMSTIDSLIDKKISERDTITLQVVTSGFIQSNQLDTSSQQTYPVISNENVSKEISSGNIERTVSIKNPDVSDQEYFEQLKDVYLKEATKDLPPGRARTDMVVRYYKHSPDGSGIYKLRELKYYIHERDVSDSTLADVASNALFYGDNIRSEDIKIVAYTLLENGIPIKTIEPSQFSKDWKADAIEIGADSTLQGEKSLTLSEVRAFIH